jgi:hypothetical protein
VMQVFNGVNGVHMLGEICDPVHYDKENRKLHA